jgi:predicted AlkP superfamily phosphohydrolase/phosphomutase
MRVLILALDGATFDLLDPWMAAGHLPTLQRLAQEGARADLMTTFPPITAAAWNSFMTGKNPGQHGIFEFLQRKPDSYEVEPMTARHRHGDSLWGLVSKAGKRVVVVGVPVTYPPEAVNGILVAGMPVPKGRVDFTHPPDLAAQILAQFPDYEINASSVYIQGQAETFLTDIRTKLAHGLALTEQYLAQGDWDLAMLHILGTDRIQHEFWHCMDQNHPKHKGEAQRYQHAILDFYKTIDSQLERLLRFADEQTTVMVISDHGFGPLHQFVFLNAWLLQEGFLVLKRNTWTRLKQLAFRLGFAPTNIYRLVALIGLGGMRGGMDMGKRQALLDQVFLSFRDVDWGRTKAYARGNFGQIFINLSGREPQGMIQPGVEYERTVNEIIGRLSNLKDPRTGQVLVGQALPKSALFSGSQSDRAPDIAVLMADETYVPLGTADFPANRVCEPAIGNTGDHRMNGILMMNGRGIQAGDLGRASLMDIAPTTLHLLGLPVPSDMDGKVLLPALSADLQQVAYQQVAAQGASSNAPTGYSAEEEAEILQHLQDLGYLG